MNPNDNDSLEKLDQSLNSRQRDMKYVDRRSRMSRHDIDVNQSWQDKDNLRDLVRLSHEEKDNNQNKFFKKILWGSIAFFVLALAVGAFIFFGGSNLVSAGNIDILVSGPTTISGGEELPLEIVIQNKNNANLEGATLSVEYPEGTKVPGDLTKDLPRERIPIGNIAARGEVTKSVKAVIFGEKDSIKNLKITLEYRVTGSSAVFYKDKNYDIGISSAPIIFTPTYPGEVNSNQEFSFKLEVASNTGEDLHNVLVKAVYPFGFTFLSSSPSPSSGKDTWTLGDLASSDKRTITIKGVLAGQNDDERTFQFTAGIAKPDNDQEIGTTLSMLSEPVTVKRPFVGLATTIGGNQGSDYVAKLNERVPVTVVWTNNLTSKIVNGQISVQIDGDALNKNLVVPADGGFYRSSENTIVWDKNSNFALSQINPGDKGVVGFSFAVLPQLSTLAQNENIPIKVIFTGSQVSSDNTPQNISSNTTANIKIATTLNLSASALHNTGAFENSGPIPPKADKETTYTIVWSLSDTLNDVSNVVATASLPPYVKWNGLVSPSSEPVIYDPVSGTVTWNAGNVKAGTGFNSSPRKVSFQITLTPSLSQVGSQPQIVGPVNVTAKDTFTGLDINLSRLELTTRTPSDPGFNEDEANVVN